MIAFFESVGWLDSIPGALEFLVLLAAGISALLIVKKYVYHPIKYHMDRVNRGMDTLLGYPAVVDPGTGLEIQPETPALAMRVWNLELNNAKVADALQTIAENQKELVELQAIMDERKSQGEQIIQEWTQWRMQHENEAKAREERIGEWEAWRQEQTLMMEAIAHAHEDPHK